MKIKEARQIIKYILDWQFVLMGVKARSVITERIELKNYSLLDLIKANSLVRASNKRKEKIVQYHRNKGNKVKPYSISMILDDRAIAAIYTALHFQPNGEAVVLINDIIVGCVDAKY